MNVATTSWPAVGRQMPRAVLLSLSCARTWSSYWRPKWSMLTWTRWMTTSTPRWMLWKTNPDPHPTASTWKTQQWTCTQCLYHCVISCIRARSFTCHCEAEARRRICMNTVSRLNRDLNHPVFTVSTLQTNFDSWNF